MSRASSSTATGRRSYAQRTEAALRCARMVAKSKSEDTCAKPSAPTWRASLHANCAGCDAAMSGTRREAGIECLQGEKRMTSKLRRLIAAVAAAPGAACAAELPSQLNLQPPQTPIARANLRSAHADHVDHAASFSCWCSASMAIAIVKHRKSVGHKAEQFHENTTVEIIWTIDPVRDSDRHGVSGDQDHDRDEGHVESRHHDQGDRLPVEVGLRLPAGGHQLLQQSCRRRATRSTATTTKRARTTRTICSKSTIRVVVPVGKKVRIITTANDVIHAWWVPALGVKQDAIPGFVRDTWFKAEQARHLPRPVRRAVRQGPRLHADRGRSGRAGEIQRSGSPSRRRRALPRRPRPARQEVDAGRAARRRARRSTQRTAWRATRRTAWASPTRSRRCPARKVATGHAGRAYRSRAERQSRALRWRRSSI